MFRGISLLGLLRQQPKTRRRQATVKPWLEELEKLILPSASPFNAQAMSQMVSTVIQVILTVENEESSEVQMINQKVAQEVAHVVQEVDHLLGIAPSEPNQSPVPASRSLVAVRVAAAARRRRFTTAKINKSISPRQRAAAVRAASATATAHGKAATQGSIKPMVSRDSGIGPGSGSGSGLGDTYTWDPPPSYPVYGSAGSISYVPGNLYASDPRNWLKDGNAQLVGGTLPGTKAGDSVVFDNDVSYGSKAIEWNQSFVFAMMTISDGYQAVQTIDAGDKIELTAANGLITPLSVDANSAGDFDLEGGSISRRMRATRRSMGPCM